MKQLITYFTPAMEIRSDRRLRVIGIGLFILALAASLIGLIAFAQESSAPSGWTPYLVSTILLIASVYALIPYKKSGVQLEPFSLNVLLFGALILALAVFMRFFRFDSVPFGTWYDEAYIGITARNILSDPSFRPLYVTAYDHPLHFYALVALAFKLFGDSTQSIRLVTVLFGLATVVVSFFVGREILGNRFGLIFAFLFAISRWHVTFSRFGVYTIAMPFFELLTIWLLLRARRTSQVHDFLWAGMAFGYGLNFYIGIRLFVPVVFLYIALWLFDTWRHRSTLMPALLSGLTVMTVATWLAVAPLAQYAVTHSYVFWGRTNDVSIFSHRDQSNLALALASNTMKHLLMFNYQGDPNGRHNLSGEPMLDPATGILFVLGLVVACKRIRWPTYSLFLMLFAFNLLGGILTVDFEAPQSNRAFGSISAALFFAAIGIEILWNNLDQVQLTSFIRRVVLPVSTILVCIFIIAYNSTTYFIRQANNDRTWLEFNGIESLAAQHMEEVYSSHTTIYASVFINDNDIIHFLDPQITDTHGILPPVGLPVREPGDKPVAIFVDPESTWIVDEAKKLYPNAQFHVDNTPEGKPALYTVLISTQDIQRLQGVTVSYWSGENPQGEPILVQNEKSIQGDWSNQPSVTPPFTARLETTLYAPQYGEYELILNSPAMSQLWIDKQQVLNGSGEQHVTLQLAQGDHVLRIETLNGDGPGYLKWRTPDANGNPSGDPTPIPLSSLYLPALVPVHGLIGNYYNGDSWSPPLVFSRIDPFLDMYYQITPLNNRPYTIDWSGQIEIPVGGDWTFGLWINGKAQVFIDGQLVVNATGPSDDIEGDTTLTAGRHSIHIRFLDYLGGSLIHLYWMSPGGQKQIVPSDALLPFP